MMLTATARENQDTACLNFALSWLLYLRQAKPSTQRSPYGSIAGVVGGDTGEQDEVTFLKTKAKETKHWSLLSSTLLDEAKLEMYRVSLVMIRGLAASALTLLYSMAARQRRLNASYNPASLIQHMTCERLCRSPIFLRVLASIV